MRTKLAIAAIAIAAAFGATGGVRHYLPGVADAEVTCATNLAFGHGTPSAAIVFTAADVGRFVVATNAVPRLYDSAVEYLECTGTQWIDTGIAPAPQTIVELVAVVRTTSSWAQFFGWSYGDKRHACRLRRDADTAFGMTWDSNLEWGLKVPGWGYTDTDTEPHTFRIDSVNNTFSVDGTASTEQWWTGWFGYYNGTQGIMLLGVGGDGTRSSGISDFTAGYVRIYSLKIWSGNTLLIDYIPVRIGTEGAMYDRVSGELFRNQGSTPFTPGPDGTNN